MNRGGLYAFGYALRLDVGSALAPHRVHSAALVLVSRLSDESKVARRE